MIHQPAGPPVSITIKAELLQLGRGEKFIRAFWKNLQPPESGSPSKIMITFLGNTPRSVLWLKDCPPLAKQNLIREAASLGIEAERIIFAKEADRHVHLARHRLADLFLDTLPYNAHATACDALWAGLPVLTCLGQSYAGRVASSLLSAVGIEELIANDLAEYEAKALELACDAIKLRGLRRKLETGVRTGVLFDTKQFRSNIESAFVKMATNDHNTDASRVTGNVG